MSLWWSLIDVAEAYLSQGKTYLAYLVISCTNLFHFISVLPDGNTTEGNFMKPRVNPLSLFSRFNQRDLQVFFPACSTTVAISFTGICLTSMNLYDRGLTPPLYILVLYSSYCFTHVFQAVLVVQTIHFVFIAAFLYLRHLAQPAFSCLFFGLTSISSFSLPSHIIFSSHRIIFIVHLWILSDLCMCLVCCSAPCQLKSFS